MAATEASVREPPANSNVVLLLLGLVYFFNFVDRQIIGILMEPIRRDLSLPDWQMGLIVGLGFALLYTTVGVPLAWLAERVDRVGMIAAALAIWSLMTILCGAAQNAVQLFLARVGVGLGEAGGSPPSHSLISDLYPPERRAGALSLWSLGSPLGSAIGLVFGAWVAEHYGWRAAFVAVGAPGFVLALALRVLVRDLRPPAVRPRATASLWACLGDQLRKPSYLLAATGAGIASIFGYVTVFWGPAYFIRRFELAPMPVAFWGALVIVGATSAGTLLGGRVTDRLAGRWPAACVVVPAIALLVAAPLYWIALASNDPAQAALLLAAPTALSAAWSGPIYALAQNLAREGARAVSTALLFLILNVIGLTLGPTLTGVLSSHFFPALGLAEGLRTALLIVTGMTIPAALLLLAAARWAPADLAAAQDHERSIAGAH